MPYKSVKELPEGVRNSLPTAALRQFMHVVNSALSGGASEESAFKQAWSVIKRRFKKGESGKWVKMKEDFRYIVPFAGEEWKLFFPLGTVYHRGRKIDFKKSDAEEMLQNFKKNRPDYPIAVNALHKDELGVYGHIADMRVVDRGVEWKPKFRPEKEAEIAEKGWKHASPEIIFKNWIHPTTGEAHNNVAVGIALTPRPRLGRATAVFSEETQEWEMEDTEVTLSELISAVGIIQKLKGLFRDSDEEIEIEASEVRKEDHMGDEFNEDKVVQSIWEKLLAKLPKPVEVKPEPKPEPQNDFSEQMATMEGKLNEFTEKLAEKETEITALSEAKEKAEKEAQEFSEKFIEEEQKRRLAEFTEQAEKLDVPVKAEEFAEVLMHFHDTDDSEEKARYAMLVSVLEAKGNAETMGKLFEESGTDAVGASVDDKLGALVKERMAKFNEDYATATTAVLHMNPEIYNEYNKGIPVQAVAYADTDQGSDQGVTIVTQ